MALLARIARRILRARGWTSVLVPPPGPKAVIIVYPHTSNFDFPLGILWRTAMGLPVSFAGKDSLFRPPFGAIFRSLGGIPVNRRERTGFVGQVVARLREADVMYLAIAPEGTRSLTAGWKSGFYHVTVQAGIPLGLGFIDYRRREVGVGAWITLSGDPDTDRATIAAFYADKTGRRPEQAGPIRWG
jgi:1-acyl-sn-glycerol-3-phosphate acyltransferase